MPTSLTDQSHAFACFLHNSTFWLYNQHMSFALPIKVESSKMISGKKLLRLVRKWHKFENFRRKQITPLQDVESVEEQAEFEASALIAKGHFVVYSTDHKRFSLPLKYLNNYLIRELFSMAEEEFGLPGEGPVVLPCEAEVLECVISLIKENVNGDMQHELARSILTCLLSLYHRQQETRHRS